MAESAEDDRAHTVRVSFDPGPGRTRHVPESYDTARTNKILRVSAFADRISQMKKTVQAVEKPLRKEGRCFSLEPSEIKLKFLSRSYF